MTLHLSTSRAKVGEKIRRFPKPCRICGVLSLEALCEPHSAQAKAIHEARRALRKAQTGQYSGEYQRRAKAVRDSAIVCHICGEERKENDPFEADHVIPASSGDTGQLLPAHRSCNRRRSNKPLSPIPRELPNPPVHPPYGLTGYGSDS
jgi:5-methylcytosine-specific restriction endonuclease McrA